MWAAIRYRRAQAVALALLSMLITACAVFAPLYERALEQSLLREGLLRNDLVATAVALDAVSVNNVTPKVAETRTYFPTALSGLYDGGTETWSGRVRYAGVERDESTLSVVAPQDTCRSLTIVQGACPTRAYDILVSAAEAKVQGWKVGVQLSAAEDLGDNGARIPFSNKLTVVGFFTQRPDPEHWLGTQLEGRAGQMSAGKAPIPLMDSWVTTAATFTTSVAQPQKGWSFARLNVTYLLNRGSVALDGLDAIPSAVTDAAAKGNAANPSVSVRSAVGDLVTGVIEGQRQARVIVPLLMGQLALLAVVVLGLVVGAAVEQRRPELALARLRGRGAGGAGRLLMGELGVIVLAGVPLGFLAALGLNELARRTWLTPGVPFELPLTTILAAVVSLLAGLLAVATVARPTLREPISTLLRRVPPRRRGWAVGFLDAVVIAVAGAGVVTLVSGNLSGPLALATPMLMSLALGLILAHLLVPVADRLGRRLAARGRVAGSLTALQVARRPAVRRVMTIITVATALTVFAADAVVVGGRNRDQRAGVETGADAVLTTNVTTIDALVNGVKAANPTGRLATPVVTIRQGSSEALTTLAVIPDQFAKVAQFPRSPEAFDWGAISTAPPREGTIKGRSVSVTMSAIALTAVDFGSGAVLPRASLTFDLYLAQPGGTPFTVSMGTFPAGSRGPLTFTKDASCEQGCRVTGFGIDTGLGVQALVRGKVTVDSVTADGSAPALIGGSTNWESSGSPDAPVEQLLDFGKPVDVGSPTKIGVAIQMQRTAAKITSSASSAALPALVVGDLPPGSSGSTFEAAGLDGLATPMSRAGSIPYVPGGGDHQAVVSMDSLRTRASQLSSLGLAQVWVSDASAVPAVRQALSKAGVDVTAEVRRSDQKALFDNSASAWGLQLALVIGFVALLIAGLVLALVAATSWRTRARDYAALRMAGVSGTVLRSVGLAEQTTVVVISVVVGGISGVLGAQLAMPILPFFTTPSTVFPVDTAPAVLPTVLAAVVCLVLLLVVGVIVGSSLVRRATLDRIREQV